MSYRLASWALILSLSSAATLVFADEMNIPASQLANLGVEFGKPEAAVLADHFQAPARVRVPPSRDFSVAPVLSGTIRQLGVSAGDRVRQGEPIAWISSPEFLALQTEYLEVLHRLELGTIRFSNDKTLNEEGIVSSRSLRESKHELEEYRLAEQRLRQLLLLSGFDDKKIDAMHDSLNLQADLILYSPVDGLVLEEFRTAGQQIDSSQAVYRIADLSELWLEIDAPISKSLEIITGSTVLVKQDNAEVSATVTKIGRHVDENSQTIIVRAVLESDSGLAPGEFVTATFTRDPSEEFLLLPTSSLVRKDARAYVFVRTPAGVEARDIEVVRQAQGRIIIGAGVGAGDSVAISGTAALKARWLGMGGGE